MLLVRVKGAMPTPRLHPDRAAKIKAVNDRVAKTHDKGFCTWTMTGQIKGPYRLMSMETVKVKRADGLVEILRVVNVEKAKPPSKLYVGDVQPDDDIARNLARNPNFVPPPAALPDVPADRGLWSRSSLESLLEQMIGTRGMLKFRASTRGRGLKRDDHRALFNAEIDRLTGKLPTSSPAPEVTTSVYPPGSRWCDLEAKLEELVGTKGLQRFIGTLQHERDAGARMAAMRAEIARAAGGQP